jgi:hypothetical protein
MITGELRAFLDTFIFAILPIHGVSNLRSLLRGRGDVSKKFHGSIRSFLLEENSNDFFLFPVSCFTLSRAATSYV